MDVQLKKGLLEASVLALLKGGDAYGYVLMRDISGLMEISESTLYPVLRRLEAQGHLHTYQLVHNGRLRKYYRITPAGIYRLEDFKMQFAEIKHITDFIFNK